MHEAFDVDKYEEDIREITDYSYFPITKETSDKIYELYGNDELTSEVLREPMASDE